MAERIMIASGKGGVGKSTAACFLGRILAEKGKNVLLVDSDPGLGALDIMLRVSDRVLNTWADVADETCDFSQAVIKVSEKLYLLPSPREYPEELHYNVINEICNKEEDSFDYIIIDSAAGIDQNLNRSVAAAHKGIFVATADEVSVRCACAAAQRAEALGMDRDNMRLLINRFKKKEAMRSRLLNIDGVIDKSGVMLLGVIPEDKKIPSLSVTGEMPGRKSGFYSALFRISERIEGKNIPLMLKKLK